MNKIPEMILTLNVKLDGYSADQVVKLMAENAGDEPSDAAMDLRMELHGTLFSAIAQTQAALIRWMSEKVGLSLEQAREEMEFVAETSQDWDEPADELVEDLNIRYKG